MSTRVIAAVVCSAAVLPAASAALLSLARVSAMASPAPAGLVCPGSTTADAQPAPPPVGYVVHLALSAGADSTARRIDVTKSCAFRFRGGGRSFQEGGAWELQFRDGHWHLGRTLESWIT